MCPAPGIRPVLNDRINLLLTVRAHPALPQEEVDMHAYKIRDDSAYVPGALPRAQIAAISTESALEAIPSPALVLQDELVRRLTAPSDERLSPGAALAVIFALGMLGWMPVIAAGWALLG